MPSLFRSLLIVLSLTALAIVGGCSEKPETSAGSEAVPATEKQQQTASTDTDADVPEIDPDELEPSGTIELKQYTVAWVASGTMGGGTLIIDGKEYPFRLAGLGIGGYGASSIDASGTVYNLPSLDAFPGTYGNARLGMTGGDSGGGKLWLRNPDGVVIELESEMRGLALAGGVDGILIQWEDEGDSKTDEAMDDTRDAAGEAIDAGGDAVQDGVDNVKGWFKKKD
ncbi:MAG: hypothetical protein V7746_18005 [Halioglobus sp.]